MKKFIEKGRTNYQQHFEQEEEGTVTVKKKPGKNKRIKNDEGDYVNYEDLK